LTGVGASVGRAVVTVARRERVLRMVEKCIVRFELDLMLRLKEKEIG
jgi:hypothetical protein